MKSRKKLTKS